jgi:hypothetical protein
MLEKEPLKRPYTMAATVMALNQALSRAAGGVSVAEHVASGFNPLQIKGDRKEVEKILGKKKIRQEFENPFPALLNGTALLVVGLLVAIATILWITGPLDEETLHQRAEAMLVEADISVQNAAMDQYLIPLVERFPNGPHANWAQEQIDQIEASNLERKIASAIRFGRELKSDEERQLMDAIKLDNAGDKESALKQYRAIITLLGDDPASKNVVNLAQRRLAPLERPTNAPDELLEKLATKMAEAETAMKANNVPEARNIWESIVNLYQDNPRAKEIVDHAADRLQQTHASAADASPEKP